MSTPALAAGHDRHGRQVLPRERIRAVLFDLDGTLIDSAPDLAGAANDMRRERGLEPAPYAQLRPVVGTGARGMLGAAFGITPADERFEAMRDEFLSRYEARMTQLTQVFEAIWPLLEAIEARGIRWGIVTNKATRFAQPLVAALDLARRSAVLIAGDTTAHAKPHPEPLLEAARRLEIDPAACIYVGDDLRDVQAGRAAGMPTAVAGWGYLGTGEAMDTWGADHLLEKPTDLLKLSRLA